MDNRPRVFVAYGYNKARKKSGITDKQFCEIADELLADPKNGSLGGGVFKKRVALEAGTRGGARTIIVYHQEDKVYFLDGWEKKNVPKSGPEISEPLLKAYKLQAKVFKIQTEQQLQLDIENRELVEIKTVKAEKKDG